MRLLPDHPEEIRIALLLIALGIAGGLLSAYGFAPQIHDWLLSQHKVSAGESAYAGFLGSLCNAGVIAAVAVFLSQGALWARWLWLVLMAVGSAIAVLRIPLFFSISLWLGVVNVTLNIVYVAATTYLFLPASRDWFNRAG